jgi:hypothetical protein
MVKVIVTSNCNSHKVNVDYKTLLILFDGNDDNIRPVGLRGNWQPKDAEILAIVKLLCEISPTFAEKLVRFALSFNQWNQAPVKSKPITDLAELIL